MLMPWDLFDDDWLMTRRACWLFITSTFFVLALTPVFLGWIDADNITLAERVMFGVLGIAGSVSLFFLWIGMWRFWVRVDQSPAMARKLWFLDLLRGFWWGSCVYC
ncbi:MAG: hypothetical protein ACRD5W_05640 [Candidatus Acidiferrales bacterium]